MMIVISAEEKDGTEQVGDALTFVHEEMGPDEGGPGRLQIGAELCAAL